MNKSRGELWPDKIVSPKRVIEKIKPWMSIFIGARVAEPRTLVKTLVNSTADNLTDLELTAGQLRRCYFLGENPISIVSTKISLPKPAATHIARQLPNSNARSQSLSFPLFDLKI